MACDDADAAIGALNSALTGPRRVSSDAGSVEQHSIPDLIKAADYLAAKCATRTRGLGLVFRALAPPSAVNRNRRYR